jgi:glutaminyl-peptide cyclotransferase
LSVLALRTFPARLAAGVWMAVVLLSGATQASAQLPTYGYQIVHAYPHDPNAFTEGLFFLDGDLYESTGLEGHSSIRKVRLKTGEVLQKLDIPAQYFGEGIVNWKGTLIELTWRSQVGFVYDLKTFHLLHQFSYLGEGWALTQDGRQIIMSDGTPDIRFLDPQTLKEVRRITVVDDGQPLQNINELEWVKGEIFANIWQTDRIARIDPASGAVVGWIDLTGLRASAANTEDPNAVLNGIAYDAKNDRLFVTGKRWPKLYEIRLVKSPDR